MSIGFIGDLILSESPTTLGIGILKKNKGDFRENFSEIKKTLRRKNYSYIVGNFEGVLKNKEYSKDFKSMEIPHTALSGLKEIGINILSIANNHTMEYGRKRFYEMSEVLKQEGFLLIGEKEKPYVKITTELGVVSIIAFSSVPAMYNTVPEYYFIDKNNENDLLINIKKLKKESDLVIVYPHWGAEYMDTPSVEQIELSKKIIDNGADMIIGHHPHIIQKSYKYKQKPIFYSLGNFISEYTQRYLSDNLMISLTLNSSQSGSQYSIDLLSLNKNYQSYCVEESLTTKLEDNIILPNKKEYNNQSLKKRAKVRNDMIKKIVFNFPLILTNKTIMVWLFKRAFFLMTNFRRINKNPNEIYKGAMH